MLFFTFFVLVAAGNLGLGYAGLVFWRRRVRGDLFPLLGKAQT
jgi:hypothetical protein